MMTGPLKNAEEVLAPGLIRGEPHRVNRGGVSVGRLYSVPFRMNQVLRGLMVVGVVALVSGLMISPRETWASVLLMSVYLLDLGLAGLFLLSLQYVSGAGWAVVLRRVIEALMILVPVGLVGIGAVLLTYPYLYEWYFESGDYTGFKRNWLSYEFLLVRGVVYALLWVVLIGQFLWNSIREDRMQGCGYYRKNRRLSAISILLVAFSFWLASVDWLMSLEPHWYSTLFGVYHFAGMLTGGLAAVALTSVHLRKVPWVREMITEEHLHDLGKLLLGFTTFWAYIWFSEYMLIWYADISEETGHYLVRTSGTWGPLFILNLILNWVIPFFALLPRGGKRSDSVLEKVAIVVLAGRWLDLFILIEPSVAEGPPHLGLSEIGIAAGVVGLAIWSVLHRISEHPLVPLGDPLLEESLHHHQ